MSKQRHIRGMWRTCRDPRILAIIAHTIFMSAWFLFRMRRGANEMLWDPDRILTYIWGVLDFPALVASLVVVASTHVGGDQVSDVVWFGLMTFFGAVQWFLLAWWMMVLYRRKSRGQILPPWRHLPLPGHCRRCGYDLRGNVSGVCPECGSRVPSVSTTPDAIDQ